MQENYKGHHNTYHEQENKWRINSISYPTYVSLKSAKDSIDRSLDKSVKFERMPCYVADGQYSSKMFPAIITSVTAIRGYMKARVTPVAGNRTDRRNYEERTDSIYIRDAASDKICERVELLQEVIEDTKT